MPPNTKELEADIQATGRLYEYEALPQETPNVGTGFTDKVYKKDYVWRNIILFAILHAATPVGIYLGVTRAYYSTLAFGEAPNQCNYKTEFSMQASHFTHSHYSS